MDLPSISKRIKKIYKSSGFTQKEFFERTSIGAKEWAFIKRNNRPSNSEVEDRIRNFSGGFGDYIFIELIWQCHEKVLDERLERRRKEKEEHRRIARLSPKTKQRLKEESEARVKYRLKCQREAQKKIKSWKYKDE